MQVKNPSPCTVVMFILSIKLFSSFGNAGILLNRLTLLSKVFFKDPCALFLVFIIAQSKDDTPVPVNTAAEEFFSKGKQYKTEEIVFADDWFLDLYRIKDEQFWEKCYYLPGNKVMSVIWKKER